MCYGITSPVGTRRRTMRYTLPFSLTSGLSCGVALFRKQDGTRCHAACCQTRLRIFGCSRGVWVCSTPTSLYAVGSQDPSSRMKEQADSLAIQAAMAIWLYSYMAI